ncbi:unnamed protein product [Mytilus edulis]|uniref:Uncharacterized protein n=1 Tax=Mytilus edulis TaxID=6550 RepID=A0A8S3V521_MYTED|nr:unnamed protein product [Mytilus edulis]
MNNVVGSIQEVFITTDCRCNVTVNISTTLYDPGFFKIVNLKRHGVYNVTFNPKIQSIQGTELSNKDSEEDRETLVVSSITVRKRIEVYPRNPKYVEKESPTTVRIRIKNIPLSADDGQLIRYLQNWHLEVLNYQRQRLRIDGFVTNCQTGDRIFYVEPSISQFQEMSKLANTVD